MQAIFEIDENRRTPKYKQIANSIIKAIRQGKVRAGDRISSINEVSNEFMLSRDTVQKAYYMLEKEHILQAVRGKGFYINRTDVLQRYRLLVLFGTLGNAAQSVFEGIVHTMGQRATIDVRICGGELIPTGIGQDTDLGEYDHCIVMPGCCPDEITLELVKALPTEKLVLLDTATAALLALQTYTTEHLGLQLDKALQPCLLALSKYHSICLVHPDLKKSPSIGGAFLDFCAAHGLEGKCREMIVEKEVVGGRVFLVKEEDQLIGLVKIALRKKLVTGKNIGIVSLGESPLMELVSGGMTTLSEDHRAKGQAIAKMILNRREAAPCAPLRLIMRKSL